MCGWKEEVPFEGQAKTHVEKAHMWGGEKKNSNVDRRYDHASTTNKHTNSLLSLCVQGLGRLMDL